jgi:glycosyltransferase involved in cell wall biosynthesis
MKSVCMLVQNYYDVDVRVRRKAEALVGAGYSVDVLALRSPDGAASSYMLAGVQVYALSLGKNRGSLVRYAVEYIAFFLWAAVRLTLLMREKRYLVVDVNTLPDFLVFAAIPARWMGARIVLDMHEITPEFYMSKYGIGQESLVVRMLMLVERVSMAAADYVITINKPIEELLVSRGLRKGKSIVIMNAVDESLFEMATAKVETRASDERKAFVMMYHGTLTRIYGLDVAIEAFRIAQKDMPGAEMWILGGGPEKTSLESLALASGLGAQVKFIGSVRPEEIPQWLTRCDIGVLPTRQDAFLDLSFSNKLSEYIIMRKATIVARLKAIRHYFSEDALAFFAPNDARDLARQMVRLYGDPGLRVRFAATAGAEYAPIRWEVMRERYLGLVGGVAAGACGGS